MALPVPPIGPFPRREYKEIPYSITKPAKARIRNISVIQLTPDNDYKYVVTADAVIIYSKDDDIYFNIKDTTKTENNFLIALGVYWIIHPADENRELHFRAVSTTTTVYFLEYDLVIQP